MGNIERVKRRLLKEAVADNLDTIRGAPPRALQPGPRLLRLWLRRAPLVLIPLTLLGSYFMPRENNSRVVAMSLAPAQPPPPHRKAPAIPQPLERMSANAFPLAVRRVVLDAGHGGSDPGATAADVTEKEITLDIGRRLRDLLERDGFEVVFTRSDDRTLPLRERASLANASRSDVFVSIHVNAIVAHTDSRGVETYYLGPTNDPKLTELATAENRSSGYSVSDLRKLLDGVYADARRDESHELATHVQREMYGTLRTSDTGLENWGVKRAPFVVLVATDMPAVLAEVGCLSNQKEAAMLDRPDYRQTIARALYSGIKSYASANQ